MNRTDYCGNIDEKFIDETIIVKGWVHKIRDIGNLIFIDLRDREGIVQVVVENSYKDFEFVKSIKTEFVIEVAGRVRKRENINLKIKTGMIEIVADKVKVISKAEELPFFPSEKKEISEEIRLRFRYIDLRKEKIKNNIALRHKVALNIRNFLSANNFYEIETPVLIKSTPEGARDFLVPSRIHPGKFYALPQSPQLFKQLLMISGFDRYFQIAKCFRDEALRSDRQPEFTQVDIEMSFVDENDVMDLSERMIKNLFKEIDVNIKIPFLKLSYNEAMSKYGTDKPDLRIKEEIEDFTEFLGKTSSNILNSIYKNDGKIRGIKFQDAHTFSRKVIDNLNSEIKELGGKGVFWIRELENKLKSSVKLTEEELLSFKKISNLGNNEVYIFIGGENNEINIYLDYIRRKFGKTEEGFKFLWVKDFPLFEKDSEGNISSLHHPFTSPKKEDIPELDKNPLGVYSNAYDIVLNGYEIGGGSIRIHSFELQKKIFQILGLSSEDIEKKFGFFIRALKTGTPPHGGIAFGLDRIIMLMAGETSIRDVIPFPKTTSGMDLMSETPSEVDESQLKELKIKITK